MIIILLLIIIFYQHKKEDNSELLNKIDKLELKLNSLDLKKDSIRTVIDSTHIKIITNENNYKERVNTIINYSDEENLTFFKDYIKKYEINK